MGIDVTTSARRLLLDVVCYMHRAQRRYSSGCSGYVTRCVTFDARCDSQPVARRRRSTPLLRLRRHDQRSKSAAVAAVSCCVDVDSKPPAAASKRLADASRRAQRVVSPASRQRSASARRRVARRRRNSARRRQVLLQYRLSGPGRTRSGGSTTPLQPTHLVTRHPHPNLYSPGHRRVRAIARLSPAVSAAPTA